MIFFCYNLYKMLFLVWKSVGSLRSTTVKQKKPRRVPRLLEVLKAMII